MMKSLLSFISLSLVLASCALLKPHHKVYGPSPFVVIQTEYGDIHIRLYDETPLHRDNFIQLVQNHFYDSLLFHRVIKGFMIQGGDPDSKRAVDGALLGEGDVGYLIPAEIKPGLFHKRGVLAAARDNNPEKKSSGCQFYIVQGKVFTDLELDKLQQKLKKTFTPEERLAYTTIGGAPHLDGNYTVFGEVLSGMSVVDSVAAQKCDANARPLKNIRMYIRFDAPQVKKEPKL